ncbi:MAG TPA: hypothetical protein VFP72_17460 [Kineosporiaceae bacterium]|nr:hypothetical protein [Kineosporiaceae bacterium]
MVRHSARHAGGHGTHREGRPLRLPWRRRTSVRIACGTCVAVAVLLAGCSGTSSPEALPTGPANPTKTPTPTPTWSLSYPPVPGASLTASPAAAEQARLAKLGLGRMRGVHLQGLVVQGSTKLVLDLTVAGTDAIGTFTAGGGTAQVRIFQKVLFVQGDAAFWEALGAGKKSLLAGKWALVSETTLPVFGVVKQFLPPVEWLERALPLGGKLAEAPGITVDGAATSGLRVVGGTATDTVYLSTGPNPAPVFVVPAEGGGLKVADSKTPPPDVTAPTGQVLDASRTSLQG